MLLVVAALAIVLLPLAWLVLPRRIRSVGTAYLAMAIVTPLGLIAPGFAYGEGGPSDLAQQLGYVPDGLQSLSGAFSAPFKDYNLPLPFFSAADAPLWHAALGYELAGLLGMLVLGGLLLGLGVLVMRRNPERISDSRSAAVG
jgi:cobalt/nickel transport system permease protein